MQLPRIGQSQPKNPLPRLRALRATPLQRLKSFQHQFLQALVHVVTRNRGSPSLFLHSRRRRAGGGWRLAFFVAWRDDGDRRRVWFGQIRCVLLNSRPDPPTSGKDSFRSCSIRRNRSAELLEPPFARNSREENLDGFSRSDDFTQSVHADFRSTGRTFACSRRDEQAQGVDQSCGEFAGSRDSGCVYANQPLSTSIFGRNEATDHDCDGADQSA